jgi:hypothetical protein
MKTLIFQLSMPGNNSWNGKWSGEGRCYAVKRRVHDLTSERLNGRAFSYNFGDGWRARAEAMTVDAATSRKVMKASQGFFGYDWMVDSIISDGAIYGPTQPKPEATTV